MSKNTATWRPFPDARKDADVKPKKNYNPNLNEKGMPKDRLGNQEPTTPRGRRRQQRRQGTHPIVASD